MASIPKNRVRIGCAGWSIPHSAAASFPEAGSHLERYAISLNAVEINTSFYRPHRPATYARWAASVPVDFAFSVKMPKHITHELRLRDVDAAMTKFITEAGELKGRLGCILVQLPPSLEFEPHIAEAFFKRMRNLYDGRLACEPRHASWFSRAAEDLLNENTVARVAADPPQHPNGNEPSGFAGFIYYRLHGSPQVYYSRYSDDFLATLARTIEAISANTETWCIFDNTAAGHAVDNALDLWSLTGNS